MRRLILLLLFSLSLLADSQFRVLKCGWYPWEPYQFVETKADKPYLAGLDVYLVQAIFKNAGYPVEYEPVAWKQHQQDIKEGRRDIAAGAFKTDERQQYAYYSEAYRVETSVLYLRKIDAAKYNFKSAEEIIARANKSDFKLGAVDGYTYMPAVINEYIKEPKNQQNILKTTDEYGNFQNLIAGKIDGFVADRMVGATLTHRYGWQNQVQEYPLTLATEPIYVIFSKKSTTPAMVEAFNKGLSELKSSGEYSEIMRQYLFPVVLSVTVNKEWFFIVELIGTIAYALSGLIIARSGGYSLFGAFVLATLPAVGGGIVRDLIAHRGSIGALKDPIYIFIVMATVAFFFMFNRAAAYYERHHKGYFSEDHGLIMRLFSRHGFEMSDALGLAAFTIVGVVVAVETKTEPLWLWGPILAVITTVGGGILRDAVRADGNNPNMKGELYPEIAFLWGMGFSYFLILQSDKVEIDYAVILYAVAVTMAGIFATRMAAVYLRLKSVMF